MNLIAFIKKNTKRQNKKEKKENPTKTTTSYMYFNFEITFKKLTIWVAYVAMFRFTNVGRNMEMLTMTSQKTQKMPKK